MVVVLVLPWHFHSKTVLTFCQTLNKISEWLSCTSCFVLFTHSWYSLSNAPLNFQPLLKFLIFGISQMVFELLAEYSLLIFFLWIVDKWFICTTLMPKMKQNKNTNAKQVFKLNLMSLDLFFDEFMIYWFKKHLIIWYMKLYKCLNKDILNVINC